MLTDPPNANKTTFITDWELFACKKIPFGLKNVGATCRRLVDQVFQRQIRQNMEIYVDDIGI